MPKKFHISNSANRNATVAIDTLKPLAGPRLGLPDRPVTNHRYVTSTESGLHEALVAKFGEDYGQALIDADPEVDLETVGRAVGKTHMVLVTPDGSVLHASPQAIEVIYGPDGEERERREPADRESNVTSELPVRWTAERCPSGMRFGGSPSPARSNSVTSTASPTTSSPVWPRSWPKTRCWSVSVPAPTGALR